MPKFTAETVAGFCGATTLNLCPSGYKFGESLHAFSYALDIQGTLVIPNYHLTKKDLEVFEGCRIVTTMHGSDVLNIIHKNSSLFEFPSKLELADIVNTEPDLWPTEVSNRHLCRFFRRGGSMETSSRLFGEGTKDAGLTYCLLASTRRKNLTLFSFGNLLTWQTYPTDPANTNEWKYNGNFWVNNAIGYFANLGYTDDCSQQIEDCDSSGHLLYCGDGTETLDQLPKVEVNYV